MFFPLFWLRLDFVFFVLELCYWKQANLLPGSRVRPIYEKPPFFFNFLIYVFNVTNKNEVIQGSKSLHLNWIQHLFQFSIVEILKIDEIFVLFLEKPKLEEIGPYFFEWVE